MRLTFAKLGIKVNITELDVDVLPHVDEDKGPTTVLTDQLNPYAAGMPSAIADEQAKRYAQLFAVYLKYRDVIDRITFWGVTDGDSWLNNWPVRGRSNYPLLFDRNGKPKSALEALTNLGTTTRN